MNLSLQRVSATSVFLAATVVAPVPPAGAAGTPALAGVVVYHGQGVRSAEVVAEVWPSQRTATATAARVKSTGKHQPVEVRTPGRVTTDGSGRFSIQADLASLPAAYRASSGQVDVELTATNGHRQSFLHTSLGPSVALRSTAVASASSLRLDLGVVRATPGTANGNSFALASPLAACYQPLDIGSRGTTEAKCANIWANGPMTGAANYKVDSTHRLSLGVAINRDAYGDFSLAGTVTRTSSTGVESDHHLHDVWVGATWTYEEYQRQCTDGYHYELHPLGLVWPNNYHATSHQAYPSCSFLYPGEHIYKDHTVNYDFTTGVNVWGVYGESQAGWSVDTMMAIKNTSVSTRGLICRSNPIGLDASSSIEGRL